MDEKKYDPYTGYEYRESEPEGTQFEGVLEEKETKSNGTALAAMILGIVSVVLMISCCCSPIAIFTGIAAIVCFAVSPKSGGSREGKALAGLICGIVAIIGTLLLILVFIFNILLSDEFQTQFKRELNDSYYEQQYDESF